MGTNVRPPVSQTIEDSSNFNHPFQAFSNIESDQNDEPVNMFFMSQGALNQKIDDMDNPSFLDIYLGLGTKTRIPDEIQL